ncbi:MULTISPECIES: sugar ABC transporter permease [unclassified Streptomyces]|uniref:carbohydrate ABC transporter permease n=1 Tax=unclassified Streptomyces TaxID=2593676 RepID=UPI00336A7572
MTAPTLHPVTRDGRTGAEQAGKPPRLPASRRNKRRFGADWKMAWAFVIPFLAFFVVFHLVPVFYALWQSFHGVEKSGGLGFDTPHVIFVGLDNYTQALTDPAFLESVGRVLLYGLVQVPVMLGLALVMALIFDTAIVRMRGLFQLVAFLPYAVPGIIASIVWAFLYLPGVSPVVDFLDGVGTHVDFLSKDNVLWSIANVATWQWTGYNMIIIFAALQAIPRDMFEAARIDGAGNWQIAWRIKVPLVAPAILITGLFSVVGTLQLFSEPTVLRTITNNVTYNYTPNMIVYNLAFGSNQPYYSAAVAVIIAIGAFLLSFGFLRMLQRRNPDE